MQGLDFRRLFPKLEIEKTHTHDSYKRVFSHTNKNCAAVIFIIMFLLCIILSQMKKSLLQEYSDSICFKQALTPPVLIMIAIINPSKNPGSKLDSRSLSKLIRF